MKTKGSSVKPAPRFRHMLRNSLPFTIPLQNEASEQNSWNSDVCKEPRDNGGFTGHANDEMVPDSLEERAVSSPSMMPRCFRTHGADRSSDILDGDPCILCDEGAHDRVLFCSEVGCPFALDEKCMNIELDLNSVKSFYCPYCWYKRLKLRSKALREKAIAAEKSLSSYLDTVMVDSSHNIAGVERYKTDLYLCRMTNPDLQKDRMEIDETDQQDFNKDQVNSAGPFRKDNHGNDKIFEYQQHGDTKVDTTDNQLNVLVIEERRETENLEVALEDRDEEINEDHREEDVELKKATDVETSKFTKANDLVDAEKSKLVEVAEDQQEVLIEEEEAHNQPDKEVKKVHGAQHEKLVENKEPHDVICEKEENSRDESALVSIKQMCDMKSSTEERKMVHRKKQLNANEEESSISSTASSNKELDEQSGSGHQRRGKILRSRVSSASSKKSVLPGASSAGKERNTGKVDTPNSLSAKRKIAAVSSERRKKLFWTPEEEKMLRKSVKKFSVEVKKNIPWSKILESGKDVFHETRTPIDLKDKWRNMIT